MLLLDNMHGNVLKELKAVVTLDFEDANLDTATKETYHYSVIST